MNDDSKLINVVCPWCDREHLISKNDNDDKFLKNIRNPKMDNLLNFKPGHVNPFVVGYPCSPKCGKSAGWPGFENTVDVEMSEGEHCILENLQSALIGHKIVKIDMSRHMLTLDNDSMIHFIANRGCGGCCSGNYDITEFNPEVIDNVITNVTLSERDSDDPDSWQDKIYEIFVFAENQEMKLLSCEGSDGNGCYGTGYRILISK